jgi:putative RecB family exonuclease
MARKFATIYDTSFLPGRVVEVDGVPLIEVEHFLELADPFEHSAVKGYIDAVVELPDGSIIPRDYKSGAMKPSSGIQLASYAAAMRDMYGIEPTTGEYLLTRGSMVTQTWDLSQLTRPVLTDLYATLERAKDGGIFLPNPGMFCDSCEVRAACIFRKTDDGEEAVTGE